MKYIVSACDRVDEVDAGANGTTTIRRDTSICFSLRQHTSRLGAIETLCVSRSFISSSNSVSIEGVTRVEVSSIFGPSGFFGTIGLVFIRSVRTLARLAMPGLFKLRQHKREIPNSGSEQERREVIFFRLVYH
jgi:hypothetical protein